MYDELFTCCKCGEIGKALRYGANGRPDNASGKMSSYPMMADNMQFVDYDPPKYICNECANKLHCILV